MGSSESKQAAARLDAAALPAQIPGTLYLRAQSPLHLRYHLCPENDADGSADAPLFLVTQPGGARGELVLYGGPSRDDAPLGLVGPSRSGMSSRLRGPHSTVRLAPVVAGAHAIQEELRARRRGVLGVAYRYGFAVAPARREDVGGMMTGRTGTARLPERYEWRGSRGEEVRSLGQRSSGWKLVRLGAGSIKEDEEDDDDDDEEGEGGEDNDCIGGATGFDYGYEGGDRPGAERGGGRGKGKKGTGREEVVAVWADVSFGRSLRNVAKFKFVGAGARGSEGHGGDGGGGGAAWRAMAVVTFLRVWQLSSQAGISGEASSSSAAATVVAAGV